MQAVFRGFQVRRQYWKIIWSVGVLEKALFRWRLKRKGFRGLKLQSSQVVNHKPDDVEEDFFQASRKQAEERIERSVVRVQAMFRSKQAQEQYRRMKLEHNKATVIVITIILRWIRIQNLRFLGGTFITKLLYILPTLFFCHSWNTKGLSILTLRWTKRTSYKHFIYLAALALLMENRIWCCLILQASVYISRSCKIVDACRLLAFTLQTFFG